MRAGGKKKRMRAFHLHLRAHSRWRAGGAARPPPHTPGRALPPPFAHPRGGGGVRLPTTPASRQTLSPCGRKSGRARGRPAGRQTRRQRPGLPGRRRGGGAGQRWPPSWCVVCGVCGARWGVWGRGGCAGRERGPRALSMECLPGRSGVRARSSLGPASICRRRKKKKTLAEKACAPSSSSSTASWASATWTSRAQPALLEWCRGRRRRKQKRSRLAAAVSRQLTTATPTWPRSRPRPTPPCACAGPTRPTRSPRPFGWPTSRMKPRRPQWRGGRPWSR